MMKPLSELKLPKHILYPIGAVGAGIVVIGGLVALAPTPPKKEEAPRPVSVFVDPVTKSTAALAVKTQGEVRARTEIDLVAQVSGRITSVSGNFIEGGIVSPGAALLQIDPTDYRLAYTRAEANVAEARLAFDRQQADAEIVKKQWDTWVKDGNPSPLALRRPQVMQAKAKLKAAEAELEQARLDLQRASVTVPFNGRVMSKQVGTGQYVAAGTPLARVFSTDVAEVRLPLTDAQVASLGVPMGYAAKPGEARAVTFTATVAGKKHSWHGKLTRVDAAVDEKTRLIYAVAEVEDPYGKGSDNGTPFAKGLFVQAEIDGASVQAALTFPRIGLRGEDQVYVVNAKNLLEARKVSVVHLGDETVAVTSGVAPGERIVTSPVTASQTGQKVVGVRREAPVKTAAATAKH